MAIGVARLVGRLARAALCLAAPVAFVTCDEAATPSGPTTTTATTVRVLFLGATARRTDLPPSARDCVNGVGATHIHPSWRDFDAIPLQPLPPDRYQITLNDVPIDRRVTFRINDQNACDDNPTGAVRGNVLANDVPLVQNATTPGNGDEPGFAITVAREGTVTQ
jgi:hypothetical protein